MSDFRRKIFTSNNNEDYLQSFHYYEKYDTTKIYDKDYFWKDFGHGLLRYQYTLVNFQNNEKFVVAEEQLTDEMLEPLKAYCQCDYHQTYWFNPIKYFICPCCVGCLEGGQHYARQDIIDKTRKYMNNTKYYP